MDKAILGVGFGGVILLNVVTVRLLMQRFSSSDAVRLLSRWVCIVSQLP